MEANEQTVAHVFSLIQILVGSDVAKIQEASKQIETLARNSGYLQVLMKILSQTMNTPVGLYASVFFKSHVMKYWVPDEGDEEVISASDRMVVKSNLVNMMLGTPEKVRAQMIQSIGIISHADYPASWPTLVDELASKLGDDMSNNQCVLEALHSMFFFYRTDSATNSLWEEIKLVHTTFFPKLLALFEKCCQALQASVANPAAFVLSIECVNLCVEVFISLNSQDIAEFVQETMPQWFNPIIELLAIKTNAVAWSNDSEPSPLDKLQATIVVAGTMFAGKYEEQFSVFVQSFVTKIWNNVLVDKTNDARFDDLICESLSFMGALARKQWYQSLFDETMFNQICSRIILPYIQLREIDEDAFEYDGAAYISRDSDGDSHSRRGNTVIFIQAMCVNFEEKITSLLKAHIASLVQSYSQSSANWKDMNTAVYLILALAVKGSTKFGGATQLNPHIDVASFFSNHVIPELQGDVNKHPMLKATCLRFLSQLRSQLPNTMLLQILGLVVRYLASPVYVVHTYAANIVEQILALVDETGKPRISSAELQPHLEMVLSSLFSVLSTCEDSVENVGVMSAVLRVLMTAESTILPLANTIITQILARLAASAQAQTNASYTHLLFEVLACLIKTLCTAGGLPAVEQFEGLLFPHLQTILSSELVDCHHYCFQIMALLLEFRTDVPGPYASMFKTLLNASLWQNNSNCPALVRFIVAFIRNGYGATFDNATLMAVLGLYQKLNNVAKQHTMGFDLIKALYVFAPAQIVMGSLPGVLKVQFGRLSLKKTSDYMEKLVDFWSAICVKHGANTLINAMMSVQNNIHLMAINNVWIPSLLTISGIDAKRLALAGTMTLLTTLFETNGDQNLIVQLISPAIGLAITDSMKTSVVVSTSESKKNIAIHAQNTGSNNVMKLLCAERESYDYSNGATSIALFSALYKRFGPAVESAVAQCSQEAKNGFLTLKQ